MDIKKDMKRWLRVRRLKDRVEIEKWSGYTYSPFITLKYISFRKLFPADPMHLFGGKNANIIC